MRIMKIDNYAFSIPDFVLDFGDEAHHTFQGSLRRHLAIERLLYRLRWFLTCNDAIVGYRIWNALLHLFFGLNCNFPRTDIAQYVLWSLRKGYYDAVNYT